ncbi:1-deoxy-D-xylulose-5-phosphate reductoisomerase [Pseudofrancisella aestuarii]|uniref:1-deoxy-D-xylulose 5-phosphate reductoisomerase n=1 Tax=Pseudofrancisella aestuarii TaxID=2670347 RepID=A0ABV9TET0_9GAMM|nr:1-deoxy-D-xylulose-5-phosphate reductoisomerase [Pseudofrancisella aestuarii]
MVSKRKITILGATGSIGDSTLAIVREKQDFNVYALTAFSNISKLAKLCMEFSPKYAVVPTLEAKDQLNSLISNIEVEILFGEEALEKVSSDTDVDVVMSAIVGIAGLKPTFAAATSGKTILLANKEALITAGHLLTNEVNNNSARLIPVDSEHNAIFQCLETTKFSRSVKEIILTASGGPFRNKSLDELTEITPEQACKHPNWSMGRKISIDSSTMVNKALEVVEAYWLFDVPADKIRVLIHPQSVIHSMVMYVDGSYIAQLGSQDMRIPIANAMYYPNRENVNVSPLDFINLKLTFEKACFDRFEALKIVFENLRKKDYAANIIFNAANEVFVDAFLNNKIKYLDIIEYNKAILEKLRFKNPSDLQEVFVIDQKAREYSRALLGEN